MYDSCDESGYYNPDVIDGGVTKNAPKDWGPALVVKENGDNFACEGLYLENSFNEYYTQEELNEYMAPAEGSFDRGAWPVSYTHLDVYKRQAVGSGEIPIELGYSWFSPK